MVVINVKESDLPYSAGQSIWQVHRTLPYVPGKHQLLVVWMFATLCHALCTKEVEASQTKKKKTVRA